MIQPLFSRDSQALQFLSLIVLGLFSLLAGDAAAWGNHTLPAYRAFEHMPEITNAAPVKAESLETFLKAEESAIEKLLAAQETWARANVTAYPPRPSELNFKSDPARSDEARRAAFLKALRIALNSRFSLYIQPDLRAGTPSTPELPWTAVNTLPEPPNASQRFIAIAPGEAVPALQVIASASDEPDYGLDINCWDDSPGDWGKTYGFGKLPFGNPVLTYSTQAPFHMGFFHEPSIIYQAAPFLQRTFPLLRAHQYSSLSVLAFRTGHHYWGWRFAGLALHYVQDLTQPYHATLAPGKSTIRLISTNVLSMVGLPAARNNLTVLLSNLHLSLEQYQSQLVRNAAQAKMDTPIVLALRNSSRDATYPAWSDSYLRDVATLESHAASERLVAALLGAMPAAYVSDPGYDFGAHGERIDLVAELSRQDAKRRAELDAMIAELLGNFGAHSRNLVREILRESAGAKTP